MRHFLSLILFALFAAPQAFAQNTSVFTELDLDACNAQFVIVDEETEAGNWQGVCPGYAGYPIYATEGDLRFDIDVGVRNDRFETPWFFNLPHTTVEWRIDAEEEPIALIHRFWSDGEGDRRSMLGVTKVGWPGEPGCLVALIAGSVPDANARATALADAIVDRIKCSDLDTYLIIE